MNVKSVWQRHLALLLNIRNKCLKMRQQHLMQHLLLRLTAFVFAGRIGGA